MRLVGGFGTLCDPLHSGFAEVFHDGEWGAICLEPFSRSTNPPEDRLVADVVCRQLGFPHGSLVIPREGAILEPARSMSIGKVSQAAHMHVWKVPCEYVGKATVFKSRPALPVHVINRRCG